MNGTVDAGANTATVPCATCRKRRVKCDKRLPGCSRCSSSAQTCPGYSRVRSFLDQGAILREKYPEQTPSRQSPPERDDTISHVWTYSTYGAPSVSSSNAGAEDAVVPARENPSDAHSVSTTPALVDASRAGGASETGDEGMASFPSDLDSLSGSDFDAVFFDIDPEVYYTQPNNCCGWIPNAHLINDAHDSLAPTTFSWYTPIGPGGTSESPQKNMSMETMPASDTEPSSSPIDEVDHEMAHLIQHFSQHISPCLDIFDIQKYFGHAVPVRALDSTLLRNLLAALSAKQFANTRREGGVASSAIMTGPTWPPAPSCLDQHYSHIPNSEWFYRAASFYDMAITQMMGLLQGLRNGTLLSEPAPARLTQGSRNSWRDTVSESVVVSPHKRRRTDAGSIRINKSLDDLLAAVTIFLLYESLDNRKVEISSHMRGAQYLLREHFPHYGLGSEGTLRGVDTAQAWRASFWNIAIVDYGQAYSERTLPRLDTQDQYLWKAAGLPLRRVNGVMVPESLCGSRDELDMECSSMTETTACRTLIWIILRALTYVSAEKDETQAQGGDRVSTPREAPPVGPEMWHAIRQNLRDWEALLPYTFKPFAILPRPENRGSAPILTPRSVSSDPGGGDDTLTIPFPTSCYSSFMASTATILYHFIQICLLLHKPLTPASSDSISRFASRRLAAYREVAQEIDQHAGKICSICLGQQPGNDASQMHMKHPLYLAGLCLEERGQRLVLEGLLKGVQRVSGWSTEWIVGSLRGEWGWHAVS